MYVFWRQIKVSGWEHHHLHGETRKISQEPVSPKLSVPFTSLGIFWISKLESPRKWILSQRVLVLRTCIAWKHNTRIHHKSVRCWAFKAQSLGQVSPGEGDSRKIGAWELLGMQGSKERGEMEVSQRKGSPILILTHQGPRLWTGNMYPGHHWGPLTQLGARRAVTCDCSLWIWTS